MARKAFIVGVNTHGLQYAQRDAELMSECLKKYDYQIIIGSGKKRDILEKLESTLGNCNQTDTVIVYFSGHGVIEKGELQFILDDSNQLSGKININEIVKLFESVKVIRHKLLILDCCNAGSAHANWSSDFLDKYYILSSTGRIEKAKELDELKAGFLTHRIHAFLSAPHADFFRTDNKVRIVDLYQWLKREAEKHNFTENAIEVSVPHLFGNLKANFDLAEIDLDTLPRTLELLPDSQPHHNPQIQPTPKIFPVHFTVILVFALSAGLIAAWWLFKPELSCSMAFYVRDAETRQSLTNASVTVVLGNYTGSRRTDSTGLYAKNLPCRENDKFADITITAPDYQTVTRTFNLTGVGTETVYLQAVRKQPPLDVGNDNEPEKPLSAEQHLLQQGYQLLLISQFTAANQLFSRARSQFPDSPLSYYWQAQVAMMQRNDDVALEYLERALQRDARHRDSLVLKIKILLLAGGEKRKTAREIAKQAYGYDKLLTQWVDCLTQHDWFTRMITTETELQAQCPTPMYEW